MACLAIGATALTCGNLFCGLIRDGRDDGYVIQNCGVSNLAATAQYQYTAADGRQIWNHGSSHEDDHLKCLYQNSVSDISAGSGSDTSCRIVACSICSPGRCSVVYIFCHDGPESGAGIEPLSSLQNGIMK